MNGWNFAGSRAVGWLVAIFLLPMAAYCSLFPLYTPTALIVALLAATTFLVVMLLCLRTGHRGERLAFRLIVLSVTGCLCLLALRRLAVWSDNVGDHREYDAFNGVCGRAQSLVRGPGDAVVMLRQVECTGAPIVPPSRDYFVFVYGSHNRAGDLGTLALGYREWSDDPGWQLAPTIKWLDKTTLLVGMGSPAYITRERRDIQGVHITYGPGGTKIRDDYVLVPCPNRASWCDR